MAKTAARYYVKLDTLWQGSPYRYAGPFASREEAEQAIQEAADKDTAEMVVPAGDGGRNVSWSGRGLDIKRAIRVAGVVSQSIAQRSGLSLDPETGNVISAVPANADELFSMEHPDYDYQ